MAISQKSRGISMPLWNELRAAIGVHFSQKPKSPTFINRSFFSLCFSVNSSVKDDVIGGRRHEETRIFEDLGRAIGANRGRGFAACRSSGRSRHRLANRRVEGGAGPQKRYGFDSWYQNLPAILHLFQQANSTDAAGACRC